MSMKELMSHGFVMKEYGYDLYSIAKAYNQLPEHSNDKILYLKDLKRYSENINSVAQAITKIIEIEEANEIKKNKI
jgi:hypothetical protein